MKTYLKPILLFCVLSFSGFNNPLEAQTNNPETVGVEDSVKEKNHFLTGYPFVFYLPETSWGFGGAGIFRFYPGKTRSKYPSVLQLGAAYTLNKQILTYFSYQLFLRENRTEIFGEVGYYDYFYLYYGVGNETNFEDEENYFVKYPRVQATYLERIKGNFRAGPTLKVDAFDITEVDSAGILDTDNTLGVEGGVVSNVGLMLRYDTRDFAYQPSRGVFATAEMSVSGKGTGSKYGYRELSLNAAYYAPLRKNHVLASNLFVGHQSGEVPFYKLFFIGGPKKNRGIIEGRFREKNIFLLQAEYRFPIYRRFAGVAFASAGQVADEFSGLLDADYHYNYGAGLRFLLDKESRLRLRLDFGFGGDGLAFYFTVGEAF